MGTVVVWVYVGLAVTGVAVFSVGLLLAVARAEIAAMRREYSCGAAFPIAVLAWWSFLGVGLGWLVCAAFLKAAGE